MGNHEHAHHGPARQTDRHRLLWSLLVIAVVFAAEVVGGLLSGSLALLSDAGHMLGDAGAHVLALVALLIATRPADSRRTYGYFRMEILAALGNGVALVFVAGFVVYKAAGRLSTPSEINTRLMMSVAAVGLVANLVSAKILAGGRSLNVRGAYWHIISDVLSSLAVLIGGAIMMFAAGLYVVDAILGLVIGVVILGSAYQLVKEAVHVLLEAVPATISLEAVKNDVSAITGVKEVHDLHIWTLTSDRYALSAHLVVAGECDQQHNDALLKAVNQVLSERHRIGHTTLQIESQHYGPNDAGCTGCVAAK